MTPPDFAHASAARPRVTFQVGLLVLLLAEILYLTVSFDTEIVSRLPDAWMRLIAWSPQLLRLSIAVVGVTVLVSGPDLWRVLGGHLQTDRRWPYFAAHICAAVAFTATTATVMGAAFPAASHRSAWALAWIATGTLTIVLWARSALPFSAWLAAVRAARWGLVWGAVAGTAAWAGGFLTERAWQPLAGYTFAVVRWMVQLIYPDAISNAARLIVGTTRFKVTISPQCSGYEGIGLIVAFLGVYLWLSRKSLRFPNALLLLPIGAAAIWILNAARIAALIVIGTSGWPAVALGGFHSQAGWLTFNAVSLGLVAIAIRGGYFEAAPKPAAVPSHVASVDSDSTTVYLGPFLAIIATSMITGALSAGFDWLYPARVIAAAAVLWSFRKTYTDMRWSWSWQSMAIGGATFAMWLALMPAAAHDKDPWPAALSAIPRASAAVWLAIRVLGYVVTVPLAEELAFRGYAMRRLQGVASHAISPRTFAWMPWLVSSVLFGAMHGSMWLAGTLAGLLFGLALVRRGALGDAVQAHATTNLLLAIYAVTTGHWSAWS